MHINFDALIQFISILQDLFIFSHNFFTVQIEFMVVHVICHNYMGEPNFDEPILKAVLFTDHGKGGYDIDMIPIS